jgi:hypothetical protein
MAKPTMTNPQADVSEIQSLEGQIRKMHPRNNARKPNRNGKR